jgi:hypothetical protein
VPFSLAGIVPDVGRSGNKGASFPRIDQHIVISAQADALMNRTVRSSPGSIYQQRRSKRDDGSRT